MSSTSLWAFFYLKECLLLLLGNIFCFIECLLLLCKAFLITQNNFYFPFTIFFCFMKYLLLLQKAIFHLTNCVPLLYTVFFILQTIFYFPTHQSSKDWRPRCLCRLSLHRQLVCTYFYVYKHFSSSIILHLSLVELSLSYKNPKNH